MSVKFDDFLMERLQDSEFRKEYEPQQPECTVKQAVNDARKEAVLIQYEIMRGIEQEKQGKLLDGKTVMEELRKKYVREV